MSSKRLLRRLLGPQRERWVLLDQVFSAGGNALMLVVAGFMLTVTEFNTYALLQFVGLTGLGITRAFISTPALVLREHPSSRSFQVRWLVLVVPALWLLNLGLLAWFVPVSWPEMWGLALLLTLPAIQDLFRMQSLALAWYRRTVFSDVLWIAIAIPPLLLSDGSSATQAAALWAAGAGISTLLMVPWKTTGLGKAPRLGPVLGKGRYEGGAVTVNQAVNWGLIAVAQWGSPMAPVGAYRLALTLLGPLNALIVTNTLTVLHTASAERGQWADHGISYRTQSQVKRLLALSAPYILVSMMLSQFVLAGEGDLLGRITMMVVLVGGFARVVNGPQMAIVRASGQQDLYFLTRVSLEVLGLLAAVAVAAFPPTGSWAFVAFSVTTQALGLLIWPRVVRLANRRHDTTQAIEET